MSSDSKSKLPKLTEEEWKRMQQHSEAVIDAMVTNPQQVMAKYPRYRELQRELAGAFLLEIIQEENLDVRKEIERGQMKKVKVFVDMAWDAEAYDKWKREEEIGQGIARSMLQELIPANFKEMSESDIHKYFDENWDKISRAMERQKRRTRYTGP